MIKTIINAVTQIIQKMQHKIKYNLKGESKTKRRSKIKRE